MTGVKLPEEAARRLFQRRLLAWYARHGRELPWRRTREPYRVLVSEIRNLSMASRNFSVEPAGSSSRMRSSNA